MKQFLVRTIIELITNETYYASMYSRFVGLTDEIIKAICKNYTFSELCEIGALCNVLRCNIRSIYPKIDFLEYMEVLNNIFTPVSPIIANCEITILWSHALHEMDARATNNGIWSPNHFVPLMSPIAHYESDDSNKSAPIVVVSCLLVSMNWKNCQIFI